MSKRQALGVPAAMTPASPLAVPKEPKPAERQPGFAIPYEASAHETKLVDHFGAAGVRLHDAQESRGLRTYVVCFTNRCGSNFLAELIATNPAFGRAGEYLLADGVIAKSQAKKFKRLQAYLGWLTLNKASPSRIFGIKLDYKQLFFLTRVGLMPGAFGEVRFIHIERQDVLAQAVSHAIAGQTKAWTSRHAGEPAQVAFDAKNIVGIMRRIHEANAALRCFFDVYQIKPVRVTYEELARSPEDVGARVIRELGFAGVEDASVRVSSTKLTKQANQVNADFMRRIREHFSEFQP